MIAKIDIWVKRIKAYHEYCVKDTNTVSKII